MFQGSFWIESLNHKSDKSVNFRIEVQKRLTQKFYEFVANKRRILLVLFFLPQNVNVQTFHFRSCPVGFSQKF